MSSISSVNLASQERRAGISLAMIYAFRMLGLFMILPVFALYTRQLPGATPFLMGLALGIYGLTQAVLQIPFGMWSDRIGRKPVIVIGLLIFAGGSLIAGSAHGIGMIIFGRAIQGCGAVAAALMALAADLSREEHRTKMMALIGTSIGMSFALAMVIGPILNSWIGISGIFYTTAVLAIVGIALLYLLVPDPVSSHFHRDAEVEPRSLFSVLGNTQLLRLNLGIFTLHFILMCVFQVLPLVLQNDMGINVHRHWEIYLPVFVVSLMIMVPFIIIAERKHAMKGIFVGAVISLIVAIGIFVVTTHSLWLTIVALIIFFAGFNLLEATLPSLVAKITSATQKGTAMGVYSSSQFLGAFAGGAIGGGAHQLWGIAGVYYTALAFLLFWLLMAVTMKQPRYLTTYLLRLKTDGTPVNVEELLAIEGVIEANIVQNADSQEPVAYLKIEKHNLNEEKLFALGVAQ